jgi:hypothetical protein
MACPAGDELEGNGLIFLIIVALESATSTSVAQGKDQLAVRHGRDTQRKYQPVVSIIGADSKWCRQLQCHPLISHHHQQRKQHRLYQLQQ